jgi:Tfp pilus assembly protein PilF
MSIIDPYTGLLQARQQESSGKRREAELTLREILSAFPLHAEALHLLATILHETNRSGEALELMQRAAQAAPEDTAIHNTFAAFLANHGRADLAAEIWLRLHQLNPTVADYCHNLGRLAQHQGQIDDAIAWYYKALQIQPASLATAEQLSELLRARGDFIACGQVLAAVLAHFPDNPSLHLRFSYALMMTGQLAAGWVEFEWRWRSVEMGRRRHQEKPQWNGDDLAGSTILLFSEQGIGDTLQFARYAPILAARGAKVVIECQPEVKSLLIQMPSVSAVRAVGEALPPFDRQLPLMSVPRLVGISLEEIPADVPYLAPEARKIKTWASRLAGDRVPAGAVRVGLVWAGNAINPNDKRRSVPLSAYAPLTRIPGVQCYSLQKGKAVPDLAGLPIIDLARHLTSFEETAALVASLDLVITIDTAVAHLAGAMNKPVWVLLAHLCDWRWMAERSDSPWYPSMRLFRQRTAGDWSAPLEQIASELKKLAVRPS